VNLFSIAPPPSRRYKLFISHAWDYKAEYEGVVGLLNGDWNFSWEDLSVPIEAPLLPPPLLPKSFRSIVHQLDERIKASDCVLILAAMYVGHRGWIQSEIEAAREFNRPIIAVAPRGQERFPEAVTRAAVEVVGWTTKSIVAAVRKHAADDLLSIFGLSNHGDPPKGGLLL
jgi:hypothetical protein